jgi:hypothetical protein
VISLRHLVATTAAGTKRRKSFAKEKIFFKVNLQKERKKKGLIFSFFFCVNFSFVLRFFCF